MMKRLMVFAYGLVSYLAFFLVFVYAVGFVGNLYVPRSLDGQIRLPFWQALAVDALLLFVFALQHSVMARPGFKRMLTRLIPEAAERGTYVLASSVALAVLFALWQPIGGTVWNISDPMARQVVNVVFGLGFALVFVSSLVIDHFDLFGLRQVSLYLVGKPYTQLAFRTPLFYRYVRHPLYVGWLTAFWATPTMTGAHLLFALLTTAYILTAMRWEERDLVLVHGAKYQAYQKQVPRLIPTLVPYRSGNKSLGRVTVPEA